MQAARKLVRTGPRGWWLLLQAQTSILQAAATVRGRPRGELVAAPVTSLASQERAAPEDEEEVRAIALAVDRVARYGVGRPLCLVRSVALQQLLSRRGIRGSSIRIGVRMNEGRFEAHAWVEWNESVVGDDPSFVREFSPFEELDAGDVVLSWARSVEAS